MKLKAGLLLLAFWPVWPWYLSRLSDGSDEPWGLLALVVLGLLLWLNPPVYSTESGSDRSVMLLLGLYLLGCLWLPELLRALLAVLALAALAASGRGAQPGIYGLALLSLPWLASLQFYLGYPMRWLLGQGAVFLLRLNGLKVVADGAALRWGEQTVLIDAPCSGVRMLWVGGFLACLLIYWYQLRWPQALLLALATFAGVLLANLSRAVTLFYFEAGIFKQPPGLHTLSGLTAFALLSLALIWLSRVLKSAASSTEAAYVATA